MSRFQSTISTFAAIGTIGLTVVAVYRAVDNQKQRDSQQQEEIRALKKELEKKSLSEPAKIVAPQPGSQAQQPESLNDPPVTSPSVQELQPPPDPSLPQPSYSPNQP